jgi:hypothetical protein
VFDARSSAVRTWGFDSSACIIQQAGGSWQLQDVEVHYSNWNRRSAALNTVAAPHFELPNCSKWLSAIKWFTFI